MSEEDDAILENLPDYAFDLLDATQRQLNRESHGTKKPPERREAGVVEQLEGMHRSVGIGGVSKTLPPYRAFREHPYLLEAHATLHVQVRGLREGS